MGLPMNIKTTLVRANMRYYPQKLWYGPEWLVLGVNNVCNLHCKMCDVGLGNTSTVFAQNLTGTKPLNMPLELITRIIGQAERDFPNVKLGYAFTEPLVYPHLIESLELAKKKGLYTSVTTNALTLPQKADALCNAGLNELFISLDGPQEIHNFIRGNERSFQKAVEGIEKLLGHEQRPEISVFCVITEWNVGHLYRFLDFFKTFPLKQVGFMHTNFTPDWLAVQHNQKFGALYPATLSNTDEISPDKMDLGLLWDEVCAIKNQHWPFRVGFSPEIINREALRDFYHTPAKLFGKRCNDVFRNIMIKSDGSVIPAHGRCYNLNIGNVWERDLKSIWNSKTISDFRKTLMREGGLLPACSRCCSAF